MQGCSTDLFKAILDVGPCLRQTMTTILIHELSSVHQVRVRTVVRSYVSGESLGDSWEALRSKASWDGPLFGSESFVCLKTCSMSASEYETCGADLPILVESCTRRQLFTLSSALLNVVRICGTSVQRVENGVQRSQLVRERAPRVC